MRMSVVLSAELRVAKTNFQKVQGSAGDRGNFVFLIVMLRLSFKLKPAMEAQPCSDNNCLARSKSIYNGDLWGR